MRRMALNVLGHNGPPRDSIRRRKLRAALNDNYRLHLLLGQRCPAIARLPCPLEIPALDRVGGRGNTVTKTAKFISPYWA
jgi:hypothetical protein